MSIRIFAVLSCLLLSVATQQGQSLLKPSDRVVFVGDSITGLGQNNAAGWAHLIQQALKTAHPDASQTVVSLGGSGQTVGSWQSVEKGSRETATLLDVKNVDVHVELGQPADVVVCMLGMNDVLCPRTGTDPASVAAWVAQYRGLIRALRERVHPRVFALATPTMCTEDPLSPKNLNLRQFAQAMASLAQEEKCVLLPTWETMQMVLDLGRTHRPDFHVTYDYVHPNAAGHMAIAAGMLRGLGEPAAAQALLDSLVRQFPPAPSLSYQVSRVESAEPDQTDRFKVSYNCLALDPAAAPAAVSLSVPKGWSVKPATIAAPSGTFFVAGLPDHLVNVLALKAGGQQAEIRIPAPWLLGCAKGVQQGWQGNEFVPAQGVLAADAGLSQGKGWGAALELTAGNPLVWKRYFAHRNYVGEDKPGAVDFAAVSYGENFSVGYGARWIAAAAPQTLNVRVRPLGFTRDNHLTVWCNGRELFAGNPKKESAPIAVPLTKGWNALVFKSNQRTWQWQFEIELTPADGHSLDDLRFRAGPPESK